MIDEDINERMARLVPQPGGIGEMPSQIPLGISMTPTFERPNAAPDIDTDYADAARRIADSRRTQMMSSLVNITAVDPDSAARSQKLGAQFGVGGDLAARNTEELRQRAFIDSISGRDMLRRNPVLADYIAQRQFAEIAHDDVDALAKTEQEFSKGWFTRFVSEGIAGIGEGFGRAVAQDEMASIYERQRQRGGRLEVYEKAALDSYREEMAKGGERTGFLEEAAYIGSQQLTGAPRIIEAGMMGATAGGGLGLVGGPAGFATVPAGMATGFAAGLAAGAFENSRRLETAMLYGELQPELGHESADRIATTVGIFNAALDTGAAALVAKPFAGLLRGAVRQKVSEAIRQQTTRAALANAAKAYGLGVAGEIGTEELQEINNVVGGELGRYLADKPMMIETEEGREAIATRLVDTFVATAMGMSIMGAPGPAGRLYVDTRAAKQGEQQAAKLQAMVKAIADNKLLARSPERLEEFAETAVEGTDSETTYVNAAVMHDILRQSGITEQEMDTVLPGVRAQLTEMQQNGIDLGNNDVTVPTAQMTVRLQKTPLLNQILPHARLSPDAMSITEVQQFEANREQLVAEARQIMETRQETDATFVAEAQAIEDRIFGEVTAAGIEGMDERAARANAQFVRDMYVTMAARMNVSPAEVERRFPYRVQGDVAPVAPLEQADQFDQSRQRNIDTPEFRAWNERAPSEGGLNKLTDDAGKPIKMYHGTPQGGFAAFDINRLGTGAGLSRGGFSFTSSEARAKAYAGPTQDEASDEEWEQVRMTEMVKQANRVFADVTYDERLVEINPAMFEQWNDDPEWYPEWDETYPESLEQVINDIKLVAGQLEMVGQTNAASRLLDIANERTAPPRPQVIEAYLYVPQNTRELNATVETIGAVLRDIDVRNEPSGAIIVNLPDGEKVVIVRNPSDIKSTDNSGSFSRATANMYDQAATIDADYLAAVERGDMATAQRMVYEAARAAGYTLRGFHGTNADFKQFNVSRIGNFGPGVYLSFDEADAREYARRVGGSKVLSVVIRATNPFRIKDALAAEDFFGRFPAESDAESVAKAQSAGYDAVLAENDVTTPFGKNKAQISVFDPSQVKSADPVTYDDQGNVVPLSRRFDITSPKLFEQAAAGPARGGFDPRRLTTILNKNADLSTFLHETAHFYLHVLGQMATDPAATPEIRADMDTLLSWFGIAGDTAEARLAAWNAMSIDQQRKYHEQFAYSFEVYLFDGKSPSVEMQGLFERFSSWLRRVYKSIRDDLNAIYRREFGEDLPILTGEVRQVMDRMLATEEQIKRQAAINEMKPQFQTQAESGMSDAEWAAYQDMQREAMDAAVTDMTKASLRQMQWLGNARSRLLRDLQRKHDRQRKEVRDEVAEEIRLQPVYRAMEYLRTGTLINFDGETIKPEGPHRLDMEAVRNIYAGMPTPESLEAIRATGMAMPTNVAPDIAALGTGGKGMMGKDGIDPDVAAELFGYSSGDALIRALLAATPMKEAIDARTDEVMLARFSDLVDPKARDAAVQTALHNEARARFVAVELRFVAKATQPTRVLIEAARQAAREMIAGKRIVDVKPQEFIAAEARAAREASKVGSPINPEAVGKAAYTRALNEALASGAPQDVAEAGAVVARDAAQAAAQARFDESRARLGADPQQALIRAKRAQLYQNQLAAEALRVREEVDKGVKYLKQVLRDSNVKRMGADYADQIERILERFNLARLSAKARAERQSLVEWLAKLEQDGLVPDLAPEVIDEANRKPYQEMTVAEFRDLVEAVKQLEYIGKNAQKIKRAEEMAEFNEVRDEIVDSIKSNYTGKVTKPRTPTTAAGRRIAGMKRFLYSHLKAAAIARIFDGGKDDGPVWRYLIRTANDAGDMETRMRAEATKRLTEILAPVFKLGKMGGKGVYFPTIGQSLNREARLVIALNMGNDGNRQRLLDGEGWTLEQLTPVLESLTEAEWNAVQQVWDFLETYRPLIAAKERRLYGKEPNWVTPTPFTVRTADGKEVRLSGGYYPIKYDPVATERAETAEEAEAAKAQLRSAYTAATTRRSFTKARARQVRGRPLLYTMSGVYGGVNDVIHDLSWHEWLIQANRLMRDEKFSSTVRETYGVEAVRQLKDWIKDNAAGEQAAQGAADQAASVLRRSVSAAGLGFNVVSAALQVTGFSQSIVRVGAKHIARGVALTVGSPIATFKAVNEKSSFMAERSRTQFRELNELRNMVQDESASARRLRLGTYFLMMRMQRMVDVPTWVGAYEKALEAGKDEDTAVALADQAVIDSQGGGMLKDLSAAERGGPVSKLFTVFYSYMNTVYNMGAVSTMTPRSKGRLASDYLMLFVVPVVLNYALKNALTPDVDDEEPDLETIAKDLIAEELAFLMGMMVVVREFQNVANVVTGKETGARGYEGPAGLRGIGETMKFATQASQGEFDRAFRKSAVNMLGLATGLPSAQINRTLDGIEALAEGETENPLAPLTGVKR